MPSQIYIKNLFNSISTKYDLLNNLLSLGLHWSWKKRFVQMIKKDKNIEILDAATGTGDIAALLYKENLKVTGIDLSPGMISVAKSRFKNIKFQVADTLNLSFPDKSFDASSIAFGIRNTESVEEALKELARVSKRYVYVLEFGTPENKVFRSLYFFFMKKFIPSLGKIFGMKSSYQYLIDSSMKFPSDSKFIELANSLSIFKNSSFQPVFGGICYIYKLEI